LEVEKVLIMESSNKTNFTHLDNQGEVKMVDVGEKPLSHRKAVAKGRISLTTSTIEQIKEDKIKKGSVLTVAKIAGIMAAKRASETIPLCHPLNLNVANVELIFLVDGVEATGYVSCNGNTGVEMEALCAVSASLLTIYDMCKAVDKSMVISDIRLISKEKNILNKEES
jgi:cyclic pyranopterin phosphate synthase